MLFKGKQLRNLLFKGKFVVLFNMERKLNRKKRSLCFTLSQTFFDKNAGLEQFKP